MIDRSMPYRIERFTVAEGAGGRRVAATIDGRDVWFESLDFVAPDQGANAFLAVALLAAMAEGRDLDLTDLPAVSPRLLDAIPTIQEIWCQWNPFLSAIDVRANRGEPSRPGAGEGLCFSGGIDAIHSALEGPPGQRLIFVSGFDYAVAERHLPATRLRLERLAEQLDSPLTMVQTNWVEWRRDRRLSGSLTHGGCLVAVAHLLGLGRTTISSSNSHQRLTPWGTHCLVDPLWSTEGSSILHWGNQFSRAEKVARVVREPSLHPYVWVCHERPVGNCGRCAKCARTRLAFHLLGSALPVEEGSAAEDPIAGYLPHLKAGSEHVYIEELMELARAGGNAAAVSVLASGARTLQRRHLLRDLRNTVFPRTAARRMATTDLQPWGFGPAPRSL